MIFSRRTYRFKRELISLLPLADIRIRESEEFYTRHQDAQDNCATLRDEMGTLRRYLSSVCTTHEQERVEAHQALDRSKAHNKALEARIAVLET
ncbi:hypothetical protein Tco_1320422 [Tanacetum coccineum]